MGKHLTLEQRYKIEAYRKLNMSAEEISNLLGCSKRTIYRELVRGRCELLDSEYNTYTAYSPELAENRVKENKRRNGRKIKLYSCIGLSGLLEYYIGQQHYSPETALFEIAQLGLGLPLVSVTSVYRYVANNLLALTWSDLPVGQYKKKKKKQSLYKSRKHENDKSIEDRPACVNDRLEFGHFEIDSVLGARESGKCLLVLTERKTRYEMIFLMCRKTAAEVISAMNRLSVLGYKDVIQTLTCDNGVEFSDVRGMEQIAPTYYCHPYSSWERGSNENANKLIRRFCKKGHTMRHLTDQEVRRIMDWMNYYPRKSLGWRRPADLFAEELHKLGIKNFMV